MATSNYRGAAAVRLHACAGLFTLLIAGCGSAPATESATATKPAAPPANATPSATEASAAASAPDDIPEMPVNALTEAAIKPWTGDFDGMVERRMIRVLTTYSRTHYFVDAGTQRGLIYEAFKQFEDDLNTTLKNKEVRVHVVFVPVAHDQLIPALLEGRGDVVAAGTLLTDFRLAQVDASNPTVRNVSSIVVSGPGVPPLASPADAAGHDVFLRLSDVAKEGVDNFNADLKKNGRPPVRIVAAPEVLSDEDLLEMVSAGMVPMTLVDDYVADFWKQIYPNLTLNRGAAVRKNMNVGFLVRKGSPKLLGELNGFLARYPEGSLRRNMLLRDYLKRVDRVHAATARDESKKLERTIELFRKYGDQYHLDYLLMGAQGYQESRLDHAARSHVGAIGIMQVMPETGKGLDVGDIHDLESNIHGGVKYIRQLEDTYFADPAIDDLNKTLFAFAAYNAGPGRVRQLRQQAARRGLNSNLWFNNVEIVTAEVVGRETVQYVSNIYKYYVAYSLLMQQRQLRQKAMTR